MTVKEAAKRLNITQWCLYKRIKQRRGIGKKFVRRPGEGWFIYAKDVK